MAHCEHCRDHLLDLVYGLLEEREQEELRGHLAECAPCRTALAETEAVQSLFARAARPIREVPVFTLPEAAPTVAVPAAAPPVPMPRRRSARRWLGWSAAAAALLMAVGTWGWYERGLAEHEAVLADSRQEVAQREAALNAVASGLANAEEAAQRRLGAEAIQVHVLGPEQLHPAAATVAQVTTRNVEGQPTPADLVVRLVHAHDNKVLYDAAIHSEGKTQVALPALAHAAGTTARLVIEARTAGGKAEVEQELEVSAPTLVAHVTTNKALYQPGEALQFRALALERYALTPPDAPVTLRAELVDRAGQAVAQRDGTTDAAGVFAGQVVMSDALVAGSYRLRLHATGPSTTLVPQEVPLEVVRDPMPELQLDKEQYRPGDQVNLYYANSAGLAQNAKPKVVVDNQSVVANMTQTTNNFGFGAVAGHRAEMTQNVGGGGQGGLQLQFALPKNLNGNYADAKILLDDGVRKKTLRQAIPVLPTQLGVDFFPEGGDLVAGLPSRVYYRVHSALGEPASLEGKLVVRSARETIESSYRHGAGSFTLTPDAKENYRAELTSPTGVTILPHPFAELGIKSEGLTLHVPASLGREGDPVQVILRQRGSSGSVLMLVECRGRLVEEQWVEVGSEAATVELRPAPGACGLLRVTAYAARADGWQPLAERLVYRAPARQLRLDAALVSEQQATQTWQFNSHDEQGKPAPAWVLAGVVDERYRARETPLASHFYLLGDLRGGQDLEDVPVLAGNAPEAQQELDLFLGTHGWRRFTLAGAVDLAKKGERRDLMRREGEREVVAPAFFSKASATLAELQHQVQGRIDAELARLRREARESRREIGAQKQAALLAAAHARAALEEYRHRPDEYVRLGLAGVVCLLIATSILSLLYGLSAVLRRRTGSPAFAASFACMVVCGILTAVTVSLPSVEPVTRTEPRAETALARDLPTPARPEGTLRLSERGATLPPPGSFASPAPALVAQQARTRLGAAARELALPQNANSARDAGKPLDSLAAKKDMQVEQRGLRALPGAAPLAPAGPAAANVPAPAGRGGAEALREKASEAKVADRPNQPVYRRSAGLPADTLLWLPALRLDSGTASTSFAVPPGPSVYRMFLLGHDATGRLGFFEARRAVPAR
jgi:hypothetical protein